MGADPEASLTVQRTRPGCREPGQSPPLPCTAITAEQVLALAECPTTARNDLWRAVQGDPAMVVALLVAAGRRASDSGPCDSLQAAIERLGIRDALQVCLEFRLLETAPSKEVDIVRHWRYLLLTAAYARAIARRLRRADGELIHTAAVLCDLTPLIPASDSGSNSGSNSGSDFGLVRPGCAQWLAERGVSEPICALVQASVTRDAGSAGEGVPSACLRLAARMAEVWVRADWEAALVQSRALASRLFGALPGFSANDFCVWVFGVLGPQAADLQGLLQIRLPAPGQAAALYRRARRCRACIDV